MRAVVWRVDGRGASADEGVVVWAPFKSLWNTAMFGAAFVLGPLYFSWSVLFLFLGLGYATLLLGHSLGMHRRLIHMSFDCPKPLERFLVWLGVLVGMAGPLGILRIHDIRDWAQRESSCHDFFAHRRGLWVDAMWQLHCRFEFDRPPSFAIEPEIADDPWYQFMERTWPLHQLALAALLYWLGGMGWVVWGVAVRVAVSVTSHWIVTYFAHNPGPGSWLVKDASVQAANLNGWGFLTHGECWHNNHHAFPESARIGVEPGQFDTGWLVLVFLRRCGVVDRIGLPRNANAWDDLMPMQSRPGPSSPSTRLASDAEVPHVEV
jgi:fatty-acid desaturase